MILLTIEFKPMGPPAESEPSLRLFSQGVPPSRQETWWL